MNEISIAEIIELLQNESASIDMQFQLWITITSAVVIASFAARNRFSRSIRTFVALMYAFASIAIALRYANDASQFVFLKSELSSRGVDYPTIIDLRFLRTLVYTLGTLATCVFVFLKPSFNFPNRKFGKREWPANEKVVAHSRRAVLWKILNASRLEQSD